jgi:hypothetical protein
MVWPRQINPAQHTMQLLLGSAKGERQGTIGA